MLFVKHAEICDATEMNILVRNLIAGYQGEQLLSSSAAFLVSKDFGDLSWEAGMLKRSRAFLQNKMVWVAVVLSLVAVCANAKFRKKK